MINKPTSLISHFLASTDRLPAIFNGSASYWLTATHFTLITEPLANHVDFEQLTTFSKTTIIDPKHLDLRYNQFLFSHCHFTLEFRCDFRSCIRNVFLHGLSGSAVFTSQCARSIRALRRALRCRVLKVLDCEVLDCG